MSPEGVPVLGLIPDVDHALALHQRRPPALGRLGFLAAGDELVVLDRLVEVHGIMTDQQAEIDRYPAAVAGGMAMPLSINTQDDIPAMMQGCAQVHLFAGPGYVIFGRPIENGLAYQAEHAGFRPVFEII